MLEKWLEAVIAERARILKRVAPVPEPHIDQDLAKEDIYAAAARLLAWEKHTGTNLDEDDFAEAILTALQPKVNPDA